MSIICDLGANLPKNTKNSKYMTVKVRADSNL